MSSSLDRHTLAKIAPKLAEVSSQLLFNDIWQREDLSPRDRSLITLSVLAAMGRTQQIPWHLDFARQNGLQQEEIIEAFTHLAFYIGWPAAVTALGCISEKEERSCP